MRTTTVERSNIGDGPSRVATESPDTVIMAFCKRPSTEGPASLESMLAWSACARLVRRLRNTVYSVEAAAASWRNKQNIYFLPILLMNLSKWGWRPPHYLKEDWAQLDGKALKKLLNKPFYWPEMHQICCAQLDGKASIYTCCVWVRLRGNYHYCYVSWL